MKFPSEYLISVILILFLLPTAHSYDWSEKDAWGYAVGATAIVGALGFVISCLAVLFFKIKKTSSPMIMNIFISFAVGALLGNVFFQIFPDVFIMKRLVDAKEPLFSSNILFLMALVGILTFCTLDIIMSTLGIDHDCTLEDQRPNSEKEHELMQLSNSKNLLENSEKTITDENKENKLEEPAIIQARTGCCSSWRRKKPEGWLNLLSCLIHNVTDGIAIGVAFISRNKSVALTTWVAIIAHETPEELGNIGILINAGFQPGQILISNAVVNVSCIIGCVIGLAIGSSNIDSEKLVLAFISGNFIYMSCIKMIPILLKEKSLWKKLLYETVAAVAASLIWAATRIK